MGLVTVETCCNKNELCIVQRSTFPQDSTSIQMGLNEAKKLADAIYESLGLDKTKAKDAVYFRDDWHAPKDLGEISRLEEALGSQGRLIQELTRDKRLALCKADEEAKRAEINLRKFHNLRDSIRDLV